MECNNKLSLQLLHMLMVSMHTYFCTGKLEFQAFVVTTREFDTVNSLLSGLDPGSESIESVVKFTQTHQDSLEFVPSVVDRFDKSIPSAIGGWEHGMQAKLVKWLAGGGVYRQKTIIKVKVSEKIFWYEAYSAQINASRNPRVAHMNA